MHRSTRAMVAGAAGAAAFGVAAALRPGSRMGRRAGRELDRAGRRLRHLDGRLRGTAYHLRGRHPDPSVDDRTLADRIRSELGTLERELDVPRVHVMVDRHVAMLHGEVGSDEDAEAVEQAVGRVAGVAGVESYLHSGLIPGDTRPSEGRAVHVTSPARTRLRAAASAAGVDEQVVDAVVRGVLGAFADRLPEAQRARVRSHLPPDVQVLFAPPRRWLEGHAPRSLHELVHQIAASVAELPEGRAEQVTAAVLHELRQLVASDAADVAAVLPADLRAHWLEDDSSESHG